MGIAWEGRRSPCCHPLGKPMRCFHDVSSLGMCANKITPGCDLIGNLVGRGTVLLGGTEGGP
jgi:hypothetical protein